MKKKNQLPISLDQLSEEQLAYLQSLARPGDVPPAFTEKEGRKIVGDIVSACRKKLGLTQLEMARRIGYDTAQFLSLVERGISKIPADRVKDFVNACETDRLLHPAIFRLIHQDIWKDVIELVDIAGGDSEQFEADVEGWIMSNL